jgi:hypothetical protein
MVNQGFDISVQSFITFVFQSSILPALQEFAPPASSESMSLLEAPKMRDTVVRDDGALRGSLLFDLLDV